MYTRRACADTRALPRVLELERRRDADVAARQRLLLLIPTTTYRTEDFVEAARTLDVDLVIASERPNVMAGEFPDHLLTLPFGDPAAAAARDARLRGARGRSTRWCRSTTRPPWSARRSREALGLRGNPRRGGPAPRATSS